MKFGINCVLVCNVVSMFTGLFHMYELKSALPDTFFKRNFEDNIKEQTDWQKNLTATKSASPPLKMNHFYYFLAE
jgi:hypothetical protein